MLSMISELDDATWLALDETVDAEEEEEEDKLGVVVVRNNASINVAAWGSD